VRTVNYGDAVSHAALLNGLAHLGSDVIKILPLCGKGILVKHGKPPVIFELLL
jgi:hypothetical protein